MAEDEQRTLISELKQGKELAEQLWRQLQPRSSAEEGIVLIEKILSSYEKALSVLNAVVSEEEMKRSLCSRSFSEKECFKKRKLMTPKWSEKMKVCSAVGVEGPPEDGFSWRKYGQKEILGARFPRGYFRCSHRFSQGCLATKQVQKSDQDPSIFEVTYNGQHSCNQVLRSSAPRLAEEALILHRKRPRNQNPPKQEEIPSQIEDFFFNFDANIDVRVKSENLDAESGLFGPSIASEIQDNHNPFPESQMDFPENPMEIGFVDSLSRSSSESKLDYFFGFCDDTKQTLESELAGFISVPNISIGDLEEYCTFDSLQEFVC